MDHQDELLKAFRIEKADLEANRLGTFGTLQRQNLSGSGNWNLIGGLLLIGFVLFAMLRHDPNSPTTPIQWLLFTAFCVAVLAVSIHYFRRIRAALADGRVDCLVGPVRVKSEGRAGWYLTVSTFAFPLPIRPTLIHRDTIYRVYVAPRSNTILAMEPTTENDPLYLEQKQETQSE